MKTIYMPKTQYIVAVTRGSKTKYFYGETLGEAMNASGIKKDDVFHYAKFERGIVQESIVTQGTKGKVARYSIQREGWACAEACA